MKRKSKRRSSQPKRKALRTTSQYLATPSRERKSLTNTAHVLSTMRTEGVSLRRAAQEHAISPQTVLRHAGPALRKTPSGKYKARASDKLLRVLITPQPGGLMEVVIRDSRSATILAEHSNAVQNFLQTGDGSELESFDGQYIIDAEGNRIYLLTDLDELERLGAAGVLSFESLYAKVG